MALLNDTFPYLSNNGIESREAHTITSISKFDDADYYCVDFLLGKNLINLSNVIPNKILRLIKNRKVRLILLNGHESFHHVVEGIYEHAVIGMRIPEEQIYLFSESADIKTEIQRIAKKCNSREINAVWIRIFEFNIQSMIEFGSEFQNPITLEIKEYPKKYLNFNRRWRPHRPMFVIGLELADILKHGHVSLALSDDNHSWETIWEPLIDIVRNNKDALNNLIKNKERIFSIPSLYLDRKDLEVNHVMLLDSTNRYYRDTYFSVVSETNYYEHLDIGRFLSEKVFKPIAHQHPFIILSRPGCLAALRSVGYKTFNGLIDESYDNETDDIKRMNMIVDEVKRLCNLTPTELENFLKTAKNICVYNYNLLRSKKDFLTLL